MCVYRPQKRHWLSAFALTYIFRLKSCKLIGVFIIHLCLLMLSKKLLTIGCLCSKDVTPLHHYYTPIRHLAYLSVLFPCPGYRTYLTPDLSSGVRKASPVARMYLVTMLSLTPRRNDLSYQSDFDISCCFHQTPNGSAFGIILLRGYFCVHFHYGLVTHSPCFTWLGQ